VIPSTYDENLDSKDFTNHGDFVEALAFNKAEEVSIRLANDPRPPELVVGADTVVILDSEVLGKPTSKDHAKKMLKR
jgi:septum formation protein